MRYHLGIDPNSLSPSEWAGTWALLKEQLEADNKEKVELFKGAAELLKRR